MAWIPGIVALKPGAIAALWGLGAVLLSKRRPIPRPLMYMFGIVGVMAWNVPFAQNNYLAFIGFQRFTVLILGCVLPLAVLPMSVASVRKLLYAYVFFHVPTAIHGIRHGGLGLQGWMGDENDLALALNTALGVATYLFFESRRVRTKLFLGAAMLLFLLTIVATMSRGGFVGLVLLGLYLIVAGPFRFRVLVLALAAALALVAFAPPSFWQEMGTISNAREEGETGDARLYFWSIGWKMFLDHPVTGVGTNNYGIRAPQYEDPNRTGWNVHTWGRVSHSVYFTVLPEQGAIGTVLFLLVVAWCFKSGRTMTRRARENPDDETALSVSLMSSGLMAATASFLATGFFLSVLYYPILWVLVALMASLFSCDSGRDNTETTDAAT